MNDHPMLFSAPMILALLREAKEPGTGKTQTRRIIEQPRDGTDLSGTHWRFISGYKPTKAKQPYMEAVRPWGTIQPNGKPMGWEIVVVGRRVAARPGDRVWCRETFKVVPAIAYRMSEGVQQTINPADPYDAAVYAAGWDRSVPRPWRPSIHMPRWASRLTLYVSEVRVQRLNDISEDDARAEGVRGNAGGSWGCEGLIEDYADLWDSINGDGSWAANPFVAAYTFVPRLGNIDTLPATLEA
jgi:hypothetical protein